VSPSGIAMPGQGRPAGNQSPAWTAAVSRPKKRHGSRTWSCSTTRWSVGLRAAARGDW